MADRSNMVIGETTFFLIRKKKKAKKHVKGLAPIYKSTTHMNNRTSHNVLKKHK
jgi:predicted nucleic acid-binding protein